jgi:hypothetical protein
MAKMFGHVDQVEFGTWMCWIMIMYTAMNNPSHAGLRSEAVYKREPKLLQIFDDETGVCVEFVE